MHSVTTILGTFAPWTAEADRGIRTTVTQVHRCANAPGLVMSRLDNWHDGSCGMFLVAAGVRLVAIVGFWMDTKGSMDPAGAAVVVRTLSLLGCDLGGGGSDIVLDEEVDAVSTPSVVVSSVLLRLDVYGFITVVLGLVDDDDDAIVPTKVRPSPSKTVRVDATMDA